MRRPKYPRVVPSSNTSVPHLTHPRGNIGMRRGSGCSCAFSGVYRPSPAFEEIEDGVRNEPATRREHVRVTVSVLLAPEKPERLDQMKVQLGTRHGDAQNAAFFFDLFRRPTPIPYSTAAFWPSLRSIRCRSHSSRRTNQWRRIRHQRGS